MIELPNDTVRLVESDDRIELWLNRPEARNAVNLATLDAFEVILSDLERNPRFLIITGGTDGFFAAGADVRDLRERKAHEALRAPNVRMYQRLRSVPLPSIAAVDGYALGGGAELALACDFRICTPRAVFGQPEADLAVLAAGGATWRLPSLVGESVTRQMLFAGRRLDGTEALQTGLADELVEDPSELMAAAHALVDKMAKRSRLSLQLTKLALEMPPGAHPNFDAVAQGLLYENGEHVARIDTFLARSSRPRPTPKD